MTRPQRLPNRARTRPAPGQMTLDAALLRAQRRYPEALRYVPSRTGTALALLPGGVRTAPTPVAAIAKRAA